jgi:hypothetical protein
VVVNLKGPTEDVDVAECNIGTKEDPKFVKFSSNLLREYIEILKEFVDVFS